MAVNSEIPAKPSIRSAPAKLLTEQEWQAVIAALELSPRHAEIICLILHGMRDKQIAAELGMSIWTVRTHLSRLFQRLEVEDRVELMLHVLSIGRSAQGGVLITSDAINGDLLAFSSGK